MTRRLAAAAAAFTVVLLLVSVLPLGLATSSRDRRDYANSTGQLARSLATLSEEAFDETPSQLSAERLRAAAGAGNGVVVVDRGGQPIAQAGRTTPVPPELLRRALAGAVTSVNRYDDVLAAAPVTTDSQIRGAVVVIRPDEPVEGRIARLWLVLAAIAGSALVLAMVLAVVAARWVTRPLAVLKLTASRWADGRLRQRADAATGPPEVREVAQALNAMAGRLDALIDGSRAVLADVSHQLRTPLSAIRLRLELVRDEHPASADDVSGALTEVARLSRLVDGLLAVARAEQVDAEPVIVDVARLVDERRQAWQPVADERDVSIAMTAVQRARASVTPGHLEQVMDNLIANALEAVEPNGRLSLAVRTDSGRVVIEVSDDGRGMTADQQERAFHRFASDSGDRGTGLGLAIVHRLVTADGGTVELSSAPDEGTTVTVKLPAGG